MMQEIFTKGRDDSMTRINSDFIYADSEAKIFEVMRGEQVKLQAQGSGTYTLKGRLSADCDWDEICTLKASSLSTTRDMSDTAVYTADVTGYSHITVDVTGFDKVYATIIG